MKRPFNASHVQEHFPNWVSGNNKLVLGDYNGDGKTDVLVTHSTGATSLMLSTGVSLVSSGYTGPAGWAKYQISTGDFNGDGRTDLALIAANTAGGNYGPPTAHQIHLSTGSGFAISQSLSNSSGNNVAYVQDFNGDGAADLWIYKYPAISNIQYTTSYQPMLLTSVDNGLGAVTTFTYKRLNDNVASPYLAYIKGNTATYPEMDMIGGQYVVSNVVAANGTGTNNTYHYQYIGARLHHQGRGFLGFSQTVIRDDQSKIDTVTTYRQDFPFIGRMAAQTQTYHPTGVVLSTTTNTYAADTLTVGVGGQRRFVKLTQSVANSRDLNNALFPTITTNYSVYDAYGNPTTVSVAGSGGDTKTTTNIYTNNSTAWLLGRLTSTTTVHALSGQPSITRKASFTYNATTGLLTQEVIEPDVAALKLTTAYGRDAYGNITTITRSGADIVTEVTTQTYDTKGRFVTGITNALSQTENFVRHAGLGVLTQHTDANALVSSFHYDGFGNMTRAIDPDGRYRDITYTYCTVVGGPATACPSNGVMQVLNTPRRLGGALQSGPITRNFYDRFGRVRAEDIEGLGGVVIRTAYEYTALGLLKRSSRPYFEGTQTPQWTTRTYDDLGRVIDEQYPDTSNTTFTYNGLTTTSTNDKNQATITLRNSQNQIFRVTEPGSMISEYLYNAVGNMRKPRIRAATRLSIPWIRAAV